MPNKLEEARNNLEASDQAPEQAAVVHHNYHLDVVGMGNAKQKTRMRYMQTFDGNTAHV